MNRTIRLAFGLILFLAGLFLFFASKKKPFTIDFAKALQAEQVVPVVVIGSGPAGLSAALYAARSALYTVVFQGSKPGGQLTETTYVENWPGTPKLLGSDLIDQNRKQAEKFGALVVNDTVVSVDLSQWPFVIKTEEGAQIHALSLIIATGSNPRKLSDTRKVPGEQAFFGYGVTTCAVCDAPFYKGKNVVVVGGGDSAVEEATLLTSYAKQVTMLVRGSAMRAAPAMQARLKGSDKIKILYNTEVTEIIGDGDTVTGIRLLNSQDKQASLLEVSGVFLAIGHTPNSHLFKEYIAVDPEGYIIVGCRDQKTSLSGVFAAGDVADHVYKQAGVAAGDGIKAALDALAFLQKHGYTAKTAAALEKHYWYPQPRQPLAHLPKLRTKKDFDKAAKEHPFMVIEVGAQHCASCTILMPIMQAVAAQLSDKAYFAQISTDDNAKELVDHFEIKGIPSILILKKGKILARYDQQMFTKRELTGIINHHLVTGG